MLRKKRGIKGLVERQYVSGTGLTNQYWTISSFAAPGQDPTRRMLVNAGQAVAKGAGYGCLLRSSDAITGDVLIGDCSQPPSSAYSSSFYIPVSGELPPQPAVSKGLSGGAVAGIVIGILVVMAAFGGVVFYFVRREKLARKAKDEERRRALEAAQYEAHDLHPHFEAMSVNGGPLTEHDLMLRHSMMGARSPARPPRSRPPSSRPRSALPYAGRRTMMSPAGTEMDPLDVQSSASATELLVDDYANMNGESGDLALQGSYFGVPQDLRPFTPHTRPWSEIPFGSPRPWSEVPYGSPRMGDQSGW